MENKELVFKDTTSLRNAMIKDIRTAQYNTVEKLLDVLKDIIYENVYKQNIMGGYTKYYSPLAMGVYSKDYRTYDLYNMFGISKVVGSNQFQSMLKIEMLENSLSHNPNLYQHANFYTGELTEEGYLDIIENGLYSSNSMVGYIAPRPFWDEFLDYCDEHYDEIFEKEFENLNY